MNRAFTVLLAILITIPAASWAQESAPKPGYILVPSLLGSRAQKQQPGFAPPLVWVYDEVGQPLQSRKSQGAHDVGEKIELPEGWYQVEVANEQSKLNRLKVFVKSGMITEIPTGLIVVAVEPKNQQPRDICNAWNGQIYVTLPVDPKPGPLIGTNRDAKTTNVGIVQVAAGYYRVQWNRFYIAVDIEANKKYHIPTGLVGPMPGNNYTLHLKKGLAASNPGLRLCKNRSTRVLTRTYWGSYNQQISEYPFKKRVWEQITVEKAKRKASRKIKAKHVRGRRYKGPGSEPLALWENPETPTPKAPAKTETLPSPSKDSTLNSGKGETAPPDAKKEPKTTPNKKAVETPAPPARKEAVKAEPETQDAP
ncbi:MAG TPA: hypothetical protein EYN06_02695 [Myxococcales bacterium]|nr:hypothetical protein [Myxococcales bacterium]